MCVCVCVCVCIYIYIHTLVYFCFFSSFTHLRVLFAAKIYLCMFSIVNLNTFIRVHVDAFLFWLNFTEIVILRDFMIISIFFFKKQN